MSFYSSSTRRRRLRLPDTRWREAVARVRRLPTVSDGALSRRSLAAAFLLHVALARGLVGLGRDRGGAGALGTSPSIRVIESEPAREFEPVLAPNPEPFQRVESEAPIPAHGPPAPSAEEIAECLTVLIEASPASSPNTGEFSCEEIWGGDTASSESAAQATDVTAQYWARVRARIADHLYYPRLARARGIGGTVELDLELDLAGVPLRIGLPPEAPRVLALAVERAVRAAAPFEPPIPGIPRRAIIPIRFDLVATP